MYDRYFRISLAHLNQLKVNFQHFHLMDLNGKHNMEGIVDRNHLKDMKP